MARYSFMLPAVVTDVKEMNIIRDMHFPKLATCVPSGIPLLITKNAALYWSESKEELVHVDNPMTYTELFWEISYQCELHNCNISATLVPKNSNIGQTLNELNRKTGSSILKTDDITIYLTDIEVCDELTLKFSDRILKLTAIEEAIEDNYVQAADYKSMFSFSELAAFIKTSLSECKTNKVQLKNAGSIYVHNTYTGRPILSPYSSFTELGCTMLFKGVLTEIFEKKIDVTKYSVFSEKELTLASVLQVNHKNNLIKIGILNEANNIHKSDTFTIRKMMVEYKKKLLNKPISFTGFSFSEHSTEPPIGATFLNFNKL